MLFAHTGTYGQAEPFNNGPHSLDVAADYREDQRGVAMTPDGTAWFASLTRGLASYNHRTAGGNYDHIRHYTDVSGLPVSGLIDLAADPDGTLWIVDRDGRLLRFNPDTLAVQVWPGVTNARRVVLDPTVTPRAVYVAMGGNGLGVFAGNRAVSAPGSVRSTGGNCRRQHVFDLRIEGIACRFFEEERHRAGFEQALFHLRGPVNGQSNDGNPWPRLFDATGGFDAVDLRDVDIHHHDIRLVPFGQKDGLFAVGRLRDDFHVRVELDEALEGRTDGRVIIHQK